MGELWQRILDMQAGTAENSVNRISGHHAGTPENFVTLGSTPKPLKFPGG